VGKFLPLPLSRSGRRPLLHLRGPLARSEVPRRSGTAFAKAESRHCQSHGCGQAGGSATGTRPAPALSGPDLHPPAIAQAACKWPCRGSGCPSTHDLERSHRSHGWLHYMRRARRWSHYVQIRGPECLQTLWGRCASGRCPSAGSPGGQLVFGPGGSPGGQLVLGCSGVPNISRGTYQFCKDRSRLPSAPDARLGGRSANDALHPLSGGTAIRGGAASRTALASGETVTRINLASRPQHTQLQSTSAPVSAIPSFARPFGTTWTERAPCICFPASVHPRPLGPLQNAQAPVALSVRHTCHEYPARTGILHLLSRRHRTGDVPVTTPYIDVATAPTARQPIVVPRRQHESAVVGAALAGCRGRRRPPRPGACPPHATGRSPRTQCPRSHRPVRGDP
jgi:hypothetical protein